VVDCLDKVDEAIACYEQALQIRPDNAEAHNNLGAALMRQEKRDRAIHCYMKAIRLKPDYADVFSNLAIALREQGRLDEASVCCQHALRLKPEHVEAQNNLGSVLMEQGRLHESLSCFEQVLRQQPGHVEAHFNRALLWLLQGNWDEGWREYEWRRQAKSSPPCSFKQPRWEGEPLDGRTLLLVGEQGLGDTLQFIRYVPLLKQRGATVIVSCQKTLVPLLTSFPGIDRLVAAGSELPVFDCHASLLCLPRIFHTTPDTLPAEVPYVSAAAGLLHHWRRELDRIPGFKIGIAWQGNATFKRDRGRSIPLVHFEPLARLPGVKLLSLQKGFGSEQALAVSDRIPMIDFGARLDDASGTFMDTAAIMNSLDLVITSDTAIAHLAGALGVPVWTALSLVPDWRWLLGREDSPWYPTMRLFRQTQLGGWPEVFERIVGELKKLVEPPNRSDSCGSHGQPGQAVFNTNDYFSAIPPAK
jgi:Tfp pilus assembly protein PilF